MKCNTIIINDICYGKIEHLYDKRYSCRKHLLIYDFVFVNINSDKYFSNMCRSFCDNDGYMIDNFYNKLLNTKNKGRSKAYTKMITLYYLANLEKLEGSTKQ